MFSHLSYSRSPSHRRNDTEIPRYARIPPSRLGVVDLGSTTIATLAILASCIFILTICSAFFGADESEPYVQNMLDAVTESEPGIVLFGENVDVDVDEPAITVRWSVIACGETLILPGSAGVHGSSCGLPAIPINIFVDGDENASFSYVPSLIPFDSATGQRDNIQNLVQFDQDYVLDVHNARLYPFDNYELTSSIGISSSNSSLVITKLATIYETSSFQVATTDKASYAFSVDGKTEMPVRYVNISVKRPSSVRSFTLFLFSVGWMLTHICLGNFWLALRRSDNKSMRMHIFAGFAVVITLPQIRNSMVDAPGFDGVLIDCIGYFPQVIISGLTVISLLVVHGARELSSESTLRISTDPELHHTLPTIRESDDSFQFKEEKSTPSKKMHRPRRLDLKVMEGQQNRELDPPFWSVLTSATPTTPSFTRPGLKPLILAERRQSLESDDSGSGQETSRLVRATLNRKFMFPPPAYSHRSSPSGDVD